MNVVLIVAEGDLIELVLLKGFPRFGTGVFRSFIQKLFEFDLIVDNVDFDGVGTAFIFGSVAFGVEL